MRGGVARYLSTLANFSGFDISVVGPAQAKRRWWSAAWDLYKRRRSYDTIVVSHVLPIGTAAMLAGFLTGKPYMVIVHGMDVGIAKHHPIRRLVASLVLRRARIVITNSKALEREVLHDFKVSRCVTVYPPVVSPGSVAPERVDTSDIRLLTVARLVPRKGHLRVLEALSLLRSSNPDLVIQYTIVGDGPMRDPIMQRIQDLRLQNVDIITQADDDELNRLYATADLFVMPVIQDPADREGFGMVFLEAAAYGIPSIATDMAGVNEAILHGHTGILVPDGDISSLADAIYQMSVDSEFRGRLGNAAKQRVKDEYSPAAQFSKLSDFL